MLIAACQTAREPSIILEAETPRSDEQLASAQEYYEADIYPFFEEFCFSCHGPNKPKGGIDLESATLVTHLGENGATWERVLAMLDSAQMPPADERQPTDFDREDIAGYIEEELDTAIAAMRPDPGRVTARRLNRQEYNNTIRDLLGVDSNPARVFPVDDSGYGFDNIGDVLTISPVLMEKYLTAAENVVDEAIRLELDPPPPAQDGKRAGRTLPIEDRKLFVCGHARGEHARGCANTILRQLASRAYRRPATKSELKDLRRLYKMVRRDGGTVEDGIQLATEAILVSPNFLFRFEGESDADDPETIQYLDDYELASRLSYFLWSSMPDETLFEIARSGELRDPEVLNGQIDRMITDARAWEFVENFAGQWLELRNLDLVYRSRDNFPEWRSEIRNAMKQESYRFFDAILRENRSILTFLDADFTFINQPLAEHYGIEGIEGEQMQRITLPNRQRGGVLTQGAVLTLTSYPTRTSPVLRGSWVMQNILGTEPPPPPEEVPPLEDNPRKLKGTIRQQLEQHRADPGCASCHSRIDPLGFGLENYDPIGRWRLEERSHPVDSSGVMPTGEQFEGSHELRDILLSDPELFVRCFTEKMLTYALGRGVEPYDRPVVAGIEESLADDDFKFHTLIREIVLSVPFQMRRGEGESEA